MLGGSRFGVSRWTVGNVKRLLPPRQSRGASLVRLEKSAILERLERQLSPYRKARKAYALQIGDAWNRMSTANAFIENGLSVKEAARGSSLPLEALPSWRRLSEKTSVIFLRGVMFDVGLEHDDWTIATRHRVSKQVVQSVRSLLRNLRIRIADVKVGKK